MNQIVKKGLNPHTGDECSQDEYKMFNLTAVHTHPVKAREMIRARAEKALRKAVKDKKIGIKIIKPPYERIATFRHSDKAPRLVYRQAHPKSIVGMLNSKNKIVGNMG